MIGSQKLNKTVYVYAEIEPKNSMIIISGSISTTGSISRNKNSKTIRFKMVQFGKSVE